MQGHGTPSSRLLLLRLLMEDIIRHFGYLYSLGGHRDIEKRNKIKGRFGEKKYIEEMGGGRGGEVTLVHSTTNPCADGINNRDASLRR